LNQPKS